MLNNLSLRKKILLLIGGTITILLIIASTFFVNHIANLSRVNIGREAQSYLQSEQLSMQSYFAEYGKLVSTFVNNPHLINFFENWDTRDQPIKNAPGYNDVNQDFIRISSNDENVLSAFSHQQPPVNTLKKTSVPAIIMASLTTLINVVGGKRRYKLINFTSALYRSI